MKRRRLLTHILGIVPIFSGCTSFESRFQTETPPRTSTVDTKYGSVDNHRITAVEALSHTAVRRSTEEGHEWNVRVKLQLKPQDTEAVTAYSIGVVFIFFDADDRVLYRESEQVPANTGSTPRTVTLSRVFRPSKASTDTFHRYRIDLVHA